MGRLTGEQAILEFSRYQRRRNLSSNTIRDRRFRLNALARWCEPNDLLDVTTAQLERFLDKRNPPYGLAPQTRYVYVGHLRTFYGWAAKQRLVKGDPAEDLVRPKLPVYMPRPWDPAEVAGAIILADERMRCWLLLAWFAGARCMEMAGMRVEDIYPDSVLLHGKGNKERIVPLHPEVRRALNQFGLPRAGFVFRRTDGWPLKAATISRYIGRYLRSVGVEATAHQGRHRYGTDLYELSGGDLLMVAALMGHSNIQTTRGYAAWSHARAGEVVARLTLQP